MLKLMFITKRPDVAAVAQNCGVDRIFVDMEYLGKARRQSGRDTVLNHHTLEDVKTVRPVISKSELLVRVNPLNKNSKAEIDGAIAAGADIIMLPMWKTAEDVNTFTEFVAGRARTMPLLETAGALENLEDVLSKCKFDELHVGLNDLHLSLNKNFLFELIADGTVDYIANCAKTAGKPFGFGGFGAIGHGLLPAENIIAEHYRLGSSFAILSRSFCDTKKVKSIKRIKSQFETGVADIRKYERMYSACSAEELNAIHAENVKLISKIAKSL